MMPDDCTTSVSFGPLEEMKDEQPAQAATAAMASHDDIGRTRTRRPVRENGVAILAPVSFERCCVAAITRW
jgi:hypothetical protein